MKKRCLHIVGYWEGIDESSLVRDGDAYVPSSGVTWFRHCPECGKGVAKLAVRMRNAATHLARERGQSDGGGLGWLPPLDVCKQSPWTHLIKSGTFPKDAGKTVERFGFADK